MLFALGVVGYPFGLAVWLSLSDAQVGETGNFVGLANYAFLLRNRFFHEALSHTVVYVGVGTVVKTVLGLGMALVLARAFPGRRLLYALLFLPFMFPVVMGTVAWYYLFGTVHGGINVVLLDLGLVQRPVPWTGTGDLAMASLITVNIWHGTPLFGFMLLAGLRSIPRDVVDAAIVDGAGALSRFRYVVAPLLQPALGVAIMLSVLGTFGDYAIVHLLTNGGPANQTQIISSLAFAEIVRNGDVAAAAGISLTLLPVYLVPLAYLLRTVARR